jgi:hypothetical protein
VSDSTLTWLSPTHRRLLGRALVALWLIGTTAYVAYDRWRIFQDGVVAEAVKRSRDEIIVRVLTQARQCQPFDMSDDKGRVQLVSTACLQRQNGSSPPSASAPAAAAVQPARP